MPGGWGRDPGFYRIRGPGLVMQMRSDTLREGEDPGPLHPLVRLLCITSLLG